mgnify:CR=1 FL=1
MEILPANRAFHPQGAGFDILYCKEDLVLVDAGTGTGKTRACLEKLHACAEKYPGMRGLILRKTRKACTDTCLVTFEEEVVPEGHPCLKGGKREGRHSYVYPNRSEIVVGGMDDPQKIMSSQWDFCLANEAIELLEDDVQALMTRMRNGKMPYHIVILDTNPSAPTHWIWRMYLAGNLPRIPTTLKDNRRFWDEKTGEYTKEGRDYLDKLERFLTGSRRDRLLEHRWSTAEGARWPQADEAVHLFDLSTQFPQGVPEGFTKFISIDHGLRNPYCALWHMVDYEGDLWTYREDYQTGCTADVQAERVLRLSDANEKYYAVFIDPSMKAQTARATARAPADKSAADFYIETLGSDPRFGPVVASIKDPSKAYPIMDALLNRNNRFANWHIERSCKNLWDELVGAVFYKSPQGMWTEDLDPKCPDHALTSAAFGCASHFKPPESNKAWEWNMEDLQDKIHKAREEESIANFMRRTKQGRSRVRY